MLYIGMLFSTFAWHLEDHYMYSINFHHLGGPKTWYGVPASDAAAFESVALEEVYDRDMKDPELTPEQSKLAALLGKTTMFSPKLLHQAGVKVSRGVQRAGEYIITFPRGYHAGFSHGFNCGEAVNFILSEWLPYGLACQVWMGGPVLRACVCACV